VVDQNLNTERNKAEKDLYYEYVESYKKVIKYRIEIINKINTLKSYCKDYKNDKEFEDLIENIKIHIKEKINEKNYLLGAEENLLYIMIWLERYLLYEKRYYSRKYDEEQKRLTYNKKSDIGIVFDENLNGKAIDELVHNKILKNELLCILKDLLTDKQYSCVFMYYYEGFTQEQIADKLKIDFTTVSKYIQNSIDKIRNSECFLNILKEFTS
jgi:RNA polymerase sigma factor (sigma-70 family)